MRRLNPFTGLRPRIAALVLHCADALEAMTSSRIYRPGMAVERALAELERGAGAQFDPQVALALVELVREGGLLTDRTTLYHVQHDRGLVGE